MPIFHEQQKTQVIERIVTVTEKGEVTVNLNICLTLKVQQDGNISVSSSVEKEEEKKMQWQVPETEVRSLPGFGKDV